MRIYSKKNSNSKNSGIVSGKNMFFSLYDSESDMRISKISSDSNNSGIVSGKNMFFV
jgi:hypothetical protein